MAASFPPKPPTAARGGGASPSGLADAFDRHPDPLVLFDKAGAVLKANAAFRGVFRQSIGPNRAPWGRVTPPDFTHGRRRFDAPAPDGKLYEWHEVQFDNGHRLASARDVSARADQANALARAKTVLFATLTHELRTPLNGILGMANLLSRADLSPTEREYLSAITRSGDHLLHLVNEILDFSRIESGRVALEAEVFAPLAIAQDVVELLSPRAHEKGIDIVAVTTRAVPEQVKGDAGRVRQILFNLAGNAVKFTETGGVTIEISAIEKGLRFAVRDSGPGVPEEKQALIFEEFQQVEDSHARKHGGAGLGLAIVRKLAAAMSGHAGLNSKLGKGSTFWVDLPLHAVGAPAALLPLDGLIVEVAAGNPVLQRGLVTELETLGARARPVSVDAPDAGVVRLIDCVLIADAQRFAGTLRRPIVLIPQESREWAEPYAACGVSYLLRPVRRASLVERIRATLGLRAAATPDRVKTADDRTLPQLDLGLKILLAEDNPINALLAKTLLARAGCQVTLAGDGEEAVAAARGGGFDLIFLDLRMPRLDGMGAARAIRGFAGPAGRVPIIALTADAGAPEREAALAAGMDDFLTKPIDPLRLAAVAARFTRDANPANVKA
jgi:signal transduction histidine kinase/ActR/RegA family two-component response regulator